MSQAASSSHAPSPGAAANPFLGLVSYDDKHPLFGRDADVELILGRLWSSTVTVLFAGTGVGKTSFLKAKLVPSLQQTFEPENVAVPDELVRQDPIKALDASREAVKAGLFTKTGSVIVFDQFEEVFQRLRDPSEFDRFGQQLARLANDSRANLRLLIAIREEFLSELTKFDDYVPGILSNYYRLERLTPRQARLIIDSTAALSTVKVSQPHLELLISDLCALRQAPSVNSNLVRSPAAPDSANDAPDTARESAPAGAAGEPADGSVDPPYLQIVCHRLWECEAPSPDKQLLTSYKRGLAERELDAYCRTKLDRLSRSERLLMAHVLEHLTGPHEAKKAVPLNELADAIGKRPEPVAKALDQLAQDDVKVLREVPKGSRIYQLYHDMYARILWRWREHQISRSWWRRTGWAALAAVVLAFAVIWPLFNWVTVYNLLGRPEEHGSPRHAALVLNARNSLARGVLLRFVGDPAWRDYTMKLETLSALADNTTAAVQYHLAGLAITGGTIAKDVADKAIGEARYLEATVHSFTPTDAAIVRDDSQGAVLVVGTSTGDVMRWSAGDEMPEAVNLAISTPTAPDATASGSPASLRFRRVLCLSRGGHEALILWTGSEVGAASDVHLGLFDTLSGALIRDTSWAPSSTEPSLSQLPRYLTFVGACSTEEDGSYFAISDYQGVRVFEHDSLAQSKAIAIPRVRKLALAGDVLAVAADGAPSVYGNWAAPNSDLEITLWNARTGVALATGAKLLLPAGAELTIRPKDSAVLGKRDSNTWVWVARNKEGLAVDTPQIIPSPPAPSSSVVIESSVGQSPTAWPIAYDETADVLLSVDLASRLLFSHTKQQPEHFAMLAVSQLQDSKITRRLAPASLASFKDSGTFVTLDDSDVRIWKRPKSLSVHRPTTRPKAGDDSNMSVSKWPALSDRERDLQPHAASGNRVIVRAGRCFYYGHSNGATYELPGGIVDVVLGPGPNRVTAVTLDELRIVGPEWPDASASPVKSCEVTARTAPAAEWTAKTQNARLLSSPDESRVIVYSTFWAHQLREDTSWTNWIEDRVYRRTNRWPRVTSVFQQVPISELSIGRDNRVSIVGTDQTIDFDAQDARNREQSDGRFLADLIDRQSMTVLPCTRDDRRLASRTAAAAASTWRGVLCNWEQRAGIEAPAAFRR